ncbi:MAG: hypothetical protein EP321_06445 [Sphingomonadales bacterium]|nr:MAG: hypothetical protein EP345_02320 [Sphingomonadales bacterium]TNF04635.1 MAG: hypothetical protein EP321_06445 [Sphingomonadales bacterium]
MLPRLLLSLLLACLALPAMTAAAGCDPAPAPTKAQAHHAMHHDEAPNAPASPASPHHDCIGCIAPIARTTYRPEREPIYGGSPIRPLTGIDGLARASGPPEPPPPRLLA